MYDIVITKALEPRDTSAKRVFRNEVYPHRCGALPITKYVYKIVDTRDLASRKKDSKKDKIYM